MLVREREREIEMTAEIASFKKTQLRVCSFFCVPCFFLLLFTSPIMTVIQFNGRIFALVPDPEPFDSLKSRVSVTDLDGTLLHKWETRSRMHSMAIALYKGTVIVVLSATNALALHAYSPHGALRSTYEGSNARLLCAHGSRVFANKDTQIQAFDISFDNAGLWTWTLAFNISLPRYVVGLVAAAAGELFAVCTNGDIYVYDVTDGCDLRVLDARVTEVHSIALDCCGLSVMGHWGNAFADLKPDGTCDYRLSKNAFALYGSVRDKYDICTCGHGHNLNHHIDLHRWYMRNSRPSFLGPCRVAQILRERERCQSASCVCVVCQCRWCCVCVGPQKKTRHGTLMIKNCFSKSS